jgi:hypothetical protein
MYNFSYKYKRLLLLLLKIVIILAALYFIYDRLVYNESLSFSQFQNQFSIVFSKNIWFLVFILLLTDANWLLEIYKWKILASTEKKISFFEAFEQCLGSLTASIITPNRIGEYGVKALYFEKKIRKKIVLLNLIGNLSQLLATLTFGTLGFTIIWISFNFEIPKQNLQNIFIGSSILIILFLLKKQLSLNKIMTYLKQLPSNLYFKTIGISFFRYLIFSHQFYFLTVIFGIETDYHVAMSLIFTMYMLASIIPAFAIFDWLIKGSIAIWLFSFTGINELTVLTITTLMWVLNVGIPSLLGTVFILNFKLIDNE